MNNLETKLDQVIKKGISYLYEHQFENGEFRCYMANNDDLLAYEGNPAGWFVEDGVLFPTALIGNSLLFLVEDPKVNSILNKVAHFLLSQRKVGSAWNHFTTRHYLYELCPFDLDDTACASAFLKARKVDFPSNSDLIQKNINNKKLFYTWITFRWGINLSKAYWRLSLRELKRPIKSFFFWKKMACSPNDVDAVVNANVLYYLNDAPNAHQVVDFLIDVVKQNKEIESDKWYKNVLTTYYFISRNYHIGVNGFEPIRQLIIDKVLSQAQPNGAIGQSVLDTALATCTLLNFNYNQPQLRFCIDYLLSTQSQNGSWAKRGFYYDGPQKLVSWGSEELTTGVCLEALWRYKKLIS